MAHKKRVKRPVAKRPFKSAYRASRANRLLKAKHTRKQMAEEAKLLEQLRRNGSELTPWQRVAEAGLMYDASRSNRAEKRAHTNRAVGKEMKQLRGSDDLTRNQRIAELAQYLYPIFY